MKFCLKIGFVSSHKQDDPKAIDEYALRSV